MKNILVLCVLVWTLSVPNFVHADPPGKLPIKVFILAGQSNMAGGGSIEVSARTINNWRSKTELTDDQIAAKKSGSLAEWIKIPNNKSLYQNLVDSDGNWAKREDVWIYYHNHLSGELKGELSVGYGSKDSKIGPELGFGHFIGDALDEPVLLIKTAWGGKSLAVDFRPPSAGECEFEIKPDRFGVSRKPGAYYRLMMTQVKRVLSGIPFHFPQLQGRDYELAGFFWHQGWNDGCNVDYASEYERNIRFFIADVRKDLGVRNLPFVIANSGFGGTVPWGGVVKRLRATVQPAQKAAEKLPQVRCVNTRPFYRPPEQSPGTGDIEHWYSNAESYLLIGRASAKAMLELMN